jgi:poly-gamma-glutamate synthesis protein (capsule biosynthesis protein)
VLGGMIGFGIHTVTAPASGASQGDASQSQTVVPVTATATAEALEATTKQTLPAPAERLDVTVAFAGDVLLHMPVIQSARSGDGYDFTPLLEGVEEWIAGADLAIAQFETPVTPAGVAPSGYPVFGGPPEIAAGLAATGWDGAGCASNHALDRGFAGIEATIDALEEQGMGFAGTARTEAESKVTQFYRLTLGGQSITVAHLAATYGLNGLPLPAGQPWSVELIDTDELIEQARQARADGADIVLVSIHEGVEYQTKPSARQREIATALADSGQVDAMIGDHPHVAEPIELVPGGVDGDGMWTIWSMGNFISNQSDSTVGPNTDTGAVAYVHITKEGSDAVVTAMTWSGVTVDTAHGHHIYMLEDAADGATLGQISAASVQTRKDRLAAIMGDAPEQTEPPVPSGATLEVLPRS